jgi:glycerophosphoryl diester phosphodiesterase
MSSLCVLGHRGAPFVAPENTLGSFRAALREGADGVELDVRRCGTGELVVCHDATLERLTGARVRIATSSLLALSRYDLGGGERIPTLRAVLDALAGAVVNVEVKADDDDPARLASAVVAELAKRRGRGPEVIVSSFAPAVLAALRRWAPWIRRGLLLDPDPRRTASALAAWREVAPHAIHPYFFACTPDRVALWHAQGLKVNAWTVDDPEYVVQVARAGVDAIITNRPADALAALRAVGLR